MPCLCRMKKYIIHGLLWLYIISTGLFVVSLEPGYLDFDNLPDTNFSCVGKVIGGYYADPETNCQMFHVCTIGQLDEPMDIRFLCLNGTVFDQETRVCERIDEVDCSKSEKFYSLNLELYGNTAPPILEENAETESPIVEKPVSSTTTTTTTTTTPRPSSTTTARTHYFTTSSRPVTPSPYHKGPSSHQFSIEQPPSYSPEEINSSLNPGAAPNIRTNPFEFPQHNSYSGNNKKTVTTPSSVFKSDEEEHSEEDNSRFSSSTTETVKNSFNQHVQPSQNTFKYNFNYHDTRPRDFNPPRGNNYQYHHNYGYFRPSVSSNNPFQYRSSTQRNEYLPITRKNFEINHPSSTSRSFFLQPIKSPSHQYFTRTEKPQGNQLPVPVLPTLSPIVFSSPAPFSLSRHIETKRYTDEHELPPRIIISASASVSDASGRTLNYSLGTIGAAQILAQPPASYDDYKEEDVVLDPFYHDVPKIQENAKRTKRDTSGNGISPGQSDLIAVEANSSNSKRSKRTPQNVDPSEIIKNEEEAVEVLKFLFDWYKTHEKTTRPPIKIPVSPELISTINEQFSQRPYVVDDYDDVAPQSLEKSVILQQTQPEITPSPYDKKVTYNKNLLYLATEGPSDNINNNNRNLFRDIENDSPAFETNEDYTNVRNNYHNTPKPPHQKLESFQTANTNKRRPYRGRHRFTFPYVTTSSPISRKKNNNDNQRRVQNSSHKDYEEFYEPQNSYNDYGSSARSTAASYFNDGSSENFENLSSTRYISSTFPSKSFLYSPVVTRGKPESKPNRNLQFDDGKIEISTQNNIETINNREQNTFNFKSTTESYALTNNKEYFEENSEVPQVTKAEDATTEAYGNIDVYDYVDDNYEPSIYQQNGTEREYSRKNESVEVKDIIHEETNINIDPEESSSEKQEETTSFREKIENEKTSNENKTTISKNHREHIDPYNSITIDNDTSLKDVLNSLRDFQKSEQNIYNYQQNITEIKPYKEELFTTKIEELSTISSTTTTEDITNTNSAHVNNESAEKTTDTTEEKNHVISTLKKEGNASSTNNYYENYIKTYEPHLYTSKPFNTRPYNDIHRSSKYETTDETTVTTSGIEEDINRRDFITTTQPYEVQEDKTTVLFSAPGNSNEFVNYGNEDFDTTTQKSFEPYEEEKITLGVENRGLERLLHSRKRVENMPVSNSKGFNGKGRNSRRRQNKPFYQQDEKTMVLSPITSTSTYYDKAVAMEQTTDSQSATENIINIEKFLQNDIHTESSYENLPSTDSLNSVPKGFYVTKNHRMYSKETSKGIEDSDVTKTSKISITNDLTNKITNEFTTPSSKYTDSISTNLDFTSQTEASITTPRSTESTYESNPTSAIEEETSTYTSKVEATTNYLRTDPSELFEDISTTPTSITTLNIKEIEEFTGSIAAIQTTVHGGKKVEEGKNIDIFERQNGNTRPLAPTTEIYTTVDNISETENQEDEQNPEIYTTEQQNIPTTESPTTVEKLYTRYVTDGTNEQKNILVKPTTDYVINTDTSKESRFEIEKYTEKGIQTTPSALEETTVEMRNTRISIITQINTEESTTQNNEKQSSDNEIVSVQNISSNTNRDARKFNNRKYQKRPKSSKTRFSSRHRFSSVNVTPRNSYNRALSKNSEIIDQTSASRGEVNRKDIFGFSKEKSFTERVLSENVKPTLESSKERNLSTTPMLYKVQLRKEKVNKQFVFNCFGKPLNHFYSDPRDCRLFHYCTNGYSKNQLLDMKFVCDLGTHFDDEKLVCTREIPKRCL